jgi:hypothetical protein
MTILRPVLLKWLSECCPVDFNVGIVLPVSFTTGKAGDSRDRDWLTRYLVGDHPHDPLDGCCRERYVIQIHLLRHVRAGQPG